MNNSENAWTRRKLLLSGTLAGTASLLFTTGCQRIGQHSTTAPRDPNHGKFSPIPTQPQPKAVVGGLWYNVQDGDTLSAIARKSGVSVDEIMAANNLRSTAIVPNTQLWLPGTRQIGIDPLAREMAPDEQEIPAAQRDDDNNDALPQAGGQGYTLVPRKKWTKTPPRSNAIAIGKVTRITVHHTSEHGGLIGVPDVEVVRRIDNYHRNGRKWCAIGYHYLIGKDGRIYEGRPANLQGAHVLSENENNIGISMIGDFDKKMPSARQLSALKAFLDDSRDRFKVSKNRVYGHRDLNRSICPGTALYGWLKGTYKA
jgi:LysM repeat protein